MKNDIIDLAEQNSFGTINNLLRDKSKLIHENQELKQQIRSLEEQLKNAIVPKFKKGQIVWAIFNEKDIFKGQIDVFDIYEKSYLIYFGVEYCGWDCGNEWITENNVFATREEAEQRLAELEGK